MTSLLTSVRAVPGLTVRVDCASFNETGFGHVGPDLPAVKVD